MSGAVFEWLTSNTHIDYPFSERQSDGLHELFVDAYLIHTKDRDKDARVRLASFDPAGTAELRFDDDTLLASLTGADNFSSSVFGSYTIYEWRRSTTIGAGFTGEDIIFRLTVHTEKLAQFSFPHLSTTSYLLSSLVNPRVSRVRRFATALPGLPCCTGGGITDKAIVLEAGNNIAMTLSEDTDIGFSLDEGTEVRAPKRIVFDAVGGEGTGAFQTCGSLESAIRRIAGVGVDDNGDFSFDGEDCTWTERRLTPGATQPPIHPNTDYLTTVIDNLMQVHGNCTECCACADYGRVYNELKRLWEQAVALASTIERLRNEYNALVQLWNLIRDAKEDGIHLKLRPLAGADFSISVMVLVYNNTGEDMTDPIDVEVEFSEDGGVYVEKSGHIDMETLRMQQLDPSIDGNKYSYTFFPLKRAQYATAIFMVRFGASVPNRRNKVIRLEGTMTAGALTDTDVQSSGLVPPLRKA